MAYSVARKIFVSHVWNRALNVTQSFAETRPAIILGIETSCDDTGCGIVNTAGEVLGEAIHSQHLTHLK